MSATMYHRTAQQKKGDFAAAREFEELVAGFLPEWKVTRFDANDELDIWVPGYYVEVKEKGQKLTQRWHLLPGVPERDLFVMDELSVRRALKHYQLAYFLLNDKPEGRLFVASAIELACVERARRNRVGKGKLILNLQDFRRIPSLEQLNEFIQADLVNMTWKKSGCLSAREVAQV